ncbi:hypothetical protein L6R52_00800 [Myxococcota bacterium]|nr:hypothetical protein [Myxococcota bacterium]
MRQPSAWTTWRRAASATAIALAVVSVASQRTEASDGPVLRVGVAHSSDRPPYTAAARGFVEELRRRGHSVTVVGLTRASTTSVAGLDLVLALGSRSARAFAEVPLSVPVVFALAGDPATDGLMRPRFRPAVRATGVSAVVTPASTVALVRAVAPGVERVGLLSAAAADVPGSNVRRLEAELVREGFVPVLILAATAEEVAPALVRAASRIDAIVAVQDPVLWSSASVKASVVFSLRERKPLFGFSTAFTRAGAVASLEVDYEAAGAQTVEHAIPLMHGVPLDQLLVTDARRATTSINLVVARRLGLEPSRTVLTTATVFR